MVKNISVCFITCNAPCISADEYFQASTTSTIGDSEIDII